jgi:hypothetical protein
MREKTKQSHKESAGEIIRNSREGVGLLIVILVLAFMLTAGLAVIAVTSAGPEVAGNIRAQEQAFNAAEAGFDAAWVAVEDFFANEEWVSFEDGYLREPYGIDIPQDSNYFRRNTDLELLALLDSDGDGTPDVGKVLFFKEPLRRPDGTQDPDFTYTAFLIDDRAVGGVTNPLEALLVCIGVFGKGANLSTARIEVELAVETQGGGN